MLIVLYRPEIPQNCGNIARTCSATGSSLLLIPPLGFYLNDKFLKRSGMDYIKNVDISICEEGEDIWFEKNKNNCWLFTSYGENLYSNVRYSEDDILLFGSESKGLPPSWIEIMHKRTCKIPMIDGNRSLNIATSVGIAVYEAKKQSSLFQK